VGFLRISTASRTAQQPLLNINSRPELQIASLTLPYAYHFANLNKLQVILIPNQVIVHMQSRHLGQLMGVAGTSRIFVCLPSSRPVNSDHSYIINCPDGARGDRPYRATCLVQLCHGIAAEHGFVILVHLAHLCY
jgi:hypothetical protein